MMAPAAALFLEQRNMPGDRPRGVERTATHYPCFALRARSEGTRSTSTIGYQCDGRMIVQGNIATETGEQQLYACDRCQRRATD